MGVGTIENTRGYTARSGQGEAGFLQKDYELKAMMVIDNKFELGQEVQSRHYDFEISTEQDIEMKINS